MMNEYKGIINKSIINSYSEILVIDIMDDKLFKYLVKDNNVSFSEDACSFSYSKLEELEYPLISSVNCFTYST